MMWVLYLGVRLVFTSPWSLYLAPPVLLFSGWVIAVNVHERRTIRS